MKKENKKSIILKILPVILSLSISVSVFKASSNHDQTNNNVSISQKKLKDLRKKSNINISESLLLLLFGTILTVSGGFIYLRSRNRNNKIKGIEICEEFEILDKFKKDCDEFQSEIKKELDKNTIIKNFEIKIDGFIENVKKIENVYLKYKILGMIDALIEIKVILNHLFENKKISKKEQKNFERLSKEFSRNVKLFCSFFRKEELLEVLDSNVKSNIDVSCQPDGKYNFSESKKKYSEEYNEYMKRYKQDKKELIETLLKNVSEKELTEEKELYTVALILAAKNGDIDTLKLIIGKGLDVNSEIYADGIRKTALMAAVENDRLEACELLIKSGANVNVTGESERTLLMLAVIGMKPTIQTSPDLKKQKIKIIKMLLETSGIELNKLDEYDKQASDYIFDYVNAKGLRFSIEEKEILMEMEALYNRLTMK
ncbi:MAG: ankyrin repeat domain-containing protein [Firmicutes bacterium]|nr:ankyrin repeat domain-containing protein [Bacillota bacterium]